ncbi:J-domain-containing protein [Cytobacillus purgationiresistens]|uniref:DnaJ homologue subfamily C member 28 conserved domain-containing protein n=1 Tax=Cytobacillus purgationiresistens TaxID=863449 RepID=A0ABU0AJD4_9BACI|nr:DUF1992 domain-containing protein [Cytobacillus purgationiresistens]MDQ0271381.1 hypothetical protein [Cytobacillus purgationiresistens]
MTEKYNDLIGEILKNSDTKDLPGKGKPLPNNYYQQDIFQNFQKIAKDAGFLPPWLELQKEISQLVHQAKEKEDMNKINKKIKDYNKICPFSMQRYPISFEGLEKAKEIW